MTAQRSITGEVIPEPRPPFVQPVLTAQQHIEAAERLLASVHRWYGNQDDASAAARGAEMALVYAAAALAHGVLAIARKP